MHRGYKGAQPRTLRTAAERKGAAPAGMHSDLAYNAQGGVPEWFNYAKALIVVLLMLRLARATSEPIYRALSFLFLIVVGAITLIRWIF